MENILSAAIAAAGARADSATVAALRAALRDIAPVRTDTIDDETLHDCPTVGVSVLVWEGRVHRVRLHLVPVEDYAAWPGPLPLGVDARMTLREVLASLGRPASGSGVFQPSVSYGLPDGRAVSFVFRDKGQRLAHVDLRGS